MMQMPVTRLSSAVVLALTVFAAGPVLAQTPGGVQQVDTPQRRAMQQCVAKVLAGLARTNAPSREVSGAVAKQCDAQLRTVLAAEIQAGRASCGSVDGCIEMARGHAGEIAKNDYERMMIRGAPRTP